MPYLQSILVVIGCTASGIFAGFILAFGLCWLMPSKPGEWGGAFLAIYLLMFGSIIGAIAGFIQGYRWVSQRGISPWKRITWLGIVAGMFVGWCMQFIYPGLLYDLTRVWLFALIPIIAFGMLGGLAGSYFPRKEKLVPRPARRKRKKKRKTTRHTSK